MTKLPLLKKISELTRKKDGNFAMMAGVLVPVLFMAGSFALDTTNTLSMKTRLQNAVDSAALATATRLYKEDNLSIADAKAFAADFLQGQVEEDKSAFSDFSISPAITITKVVDNGRTIWQVAIAVTGTHEATQMARLMGRDKLSVSVAGKSESGSASSQGSISMALVLDQSGSMDWTLDGQKKINVLKTAVFGLVQQFKKVDPKGDYIRLGSVSYNSAVTGKHNMTWNIESVRSFVGNLGATGGTDSTDAFKWGYQKINSPTETTEHNTRTGQEPERIIVFMTDGDNNYYSADASTKLLCDTAKADGLTVYTVAFAAPDRGKKLLSYCADQPEHYFDAKNSQELIDAFKNIGEQTSEVVSRITQ
ncbi:TadE/TadG family type IV pilus assembly protein [Hoeflea sp.]|uniref:TadE/TadG family type IV pilus assembly protein n=1 Tax=Hoeflea sp. TaxID=1940281 RepID=UPI0019A8712C|nr:TadE/TadG family type IV pilus assembly protein [Hoeflea sp.]MBC7281644.1 VWA domain-containing protein [Hoeflea sp.]